MTNLVHTHKSQQFGAQVEWSKTENRKKLTLHSERFFRHQINKFEVGTEVSLYLTNQKPKRTEQQNRYYWGVYLPLIAKETGEDNLDRLHELFKGEFLTSEIAEVLGKKVRMKKSTTDLTVVEFGEYIMSIERLTGVEAPPTENYNLAPLRPRSVSYPQD